MEKGRLHIVRDVTADDPIPTEAFLCSFSELAVKGVFLDDIMGSPDGVLKGDELLAMYESKQIMELKEAIRKTNPKEMYVIVEKQPSNALWTLLANKSLEELEF